MGKRMRRRKSSTLANAQKICLAKQDSLLRDWYVLIFRDFSHVYAIATYNTVVRQVTSTVTQWRLVITLLEGHTDSPDRDGSERDSSITCLLALLCTLCLKCGIISGCTEIITCCHSRAPTGDAGTLLWGRAKRWEEKKERKKEIRPHVLRGIAAWALERQFGSAGSATSHVLIKRTEVFRKASQCPWGVDNCAGGGWFILVGWANEATGTDPHRTRMSNEL